MLSFAMPITVALITMKQIKTERRKFVIALLLTLSENNEKNKCEFKEKKQYHNGSAISHLKLRFRKYDKNLSG